MGSYKARHGRYINEVCISLVSCWQVCSMSKDCPVVIRLETDLADDGTASSVVPMLHLADHIAAPSSCWWLRVTANIEGIYLLNAAPTATRTHL